MLCVAKAKLENSARYPYLPTNGNFSSLQNRKNYQCVKNIEGQRHRVSVLNNNTSSENSIRQNRAHTSKGLQPIHGRECKFEETIKMENGWRASKQNRLERRRTTAKARKNLINIRPYRIALLLKRAPTQTSTLMPFMDVNVNQHTGGIQKNESLFTVSK